MATCFFHVTALLFGHCSLLFQAKHSLTIVVLRTGSAEVKSDGQVRLNVFQLLGFPLVVHIATGN